MRYEFLLIAAAFACYLVIHHRRAKASVKAERAAMFNECTSLFETYTLKQDGIYYPVLRGIYRGHDMTLEPIVDHAGFRMLPSLWLLVSVRGRVPFGGIFDYLRRPKNVEFYSPSWNLQKDVVIPDGWPKDAWLRSDRPDRMPPIDLMDPHMALFEDIKAKELMVTPNGARIVYQAHEAIRSYYMLLRQVKFEDIMLKSDLVRMLMDRVISLYEDLIKETPGSGKEIEKAPVKQ